MSEPDLYLQPKRRLPWVGWLAIGLVGILLLGAGGLAVILGARHFGGAPAATAPVSTLVPTFTPRPAATAAPSVVTLSVQPWTDDRGPVGLVAVTLSLPTTARVSHEPPPGYRYWRGDLLRTQQDWAWTGSGEIHWYLFREPGTTFPATLEVVVNDQTLTIDLQPATPATVSVELQE